MAMGRGKEIVPKSRRPAFLGGGGTILVAYFPQHCVNGVLARVEKSGYRRSSRVPCEGERIQVCNVFLHRIPYFPSNSEDRVRKGAEKLQKFLSAKQQGRLDGFFTAKPKTSPKKEDTKGKDSKGKKASAKTPAKRKAEEKAEKSGSKKTKIKK